MVTKQYLAPAVLACGLLAIPAVTVLLWQSHSNCQWKERVRTTDDALEFGKYWLRRDERTWRDLGFDSLAALNRELAKSPCCHAEPIDPVQNDGREWSVSVRVVGPGRSNVHYSLTFDACREAAELKVIETRS